MGSRERSTRGNEPVFSCQILQLVDQAAGFIGLDALGDSWLLQRGSQLVEMLRAGREREVSLLPGADRWRPGFLFES